MVNMVLDIFLKISRNETRQLKLLNMFESEFGQIGNVALPYFKFCYGSLNNTATSSEFKTTKWPLRQNLGPRTLGISHRRGANVEAFNQMLWKKKPQR